MPTARMRQRPATGMHPRTRGRAHPPHRRREASASKRSWPKHASSRPSSRRSTGRRGLLRATIAGEASACGERALELGKQARERINADFNVDDPNTSSCASQQLIAAGTLLRACPHPRHPRRATCTVRCRLSSSRRPYNRPKALHPAYASRAVRGTTVALKGKRRPSTRVVRWGNQ
jgi:hypothetical protein